MNNQENFIAYEYKNIAVKRNSVALHTDCLKNFGWDLIEEHTHGYAPQVNTPVNNTGNVPSYTVQTPPEKVEEVDMVTLKFKRDRKLINKREIDKLERQCEEALAVIAKLEKKNSAQTMGISLGTGIVGTAFLVLAAYNFGVGGIVSGVIFTVIGAVGWAVGFFANRKVGKKKSAQSEPVIQQQLDVVYSICEQAHALLA